VIAGDVRPSIHAAPAGGGREKGGAMRVDSEPSRRADRAAEAILLAMTCLSPWAFGSVEAWAVAAIDAGVVLLAVLNIVARRSRPEAPRGASLPGLALASLALLGFFQTLATTGERPGTASASPERVVGDPGPPVPGPGRAISGLPEETRNVAWRLVSAWVIFQSVIGLRDRSAALRRFGTAVAATATALSLFAMAQSLTWNGKIYWSRPSPHEGAWFSGGPFVCHSHLAAYLNIGLGFALASLGGTGRRGTRVWAAYASAVIAVGIVASQSRSGFVAMLGAMVVVVCLNPRALKYAAAASAVACLAGLLIAALPGGPSLDRLATILDPTSRGYTARFEIWGEAVEAWRAHPIWGSGLGSFGTAVAAFGRRDRGVFFARAENEYLDLLVEGGVVGLGIALIGLVGAAVLARRAVKSQVPSGGGPFILGAVFGAAALTIQSLGDFAIHIPALAVTATTLAALVCGIGLEAGRRSRPTGAGRRWAGGPLLAGIATAALAVGALLHDIPLVRAEAAMAGTDLPPPGSSSPALRTPKVPRDVLERRLAALDEAVRHRPGWAEGHLRRGLTLVALYERSAAEVVEESTGDAERAASLGEILRLHGLMHPREGPAPVALADLIEHDPVRLYLIPAARSYLEARRCGPDLAQPEAGLASLDFLLEGGDPSSSHARRALRLAGSDRRVHVFVAEVAAQAGDLLLAAHGYRKALAAGDLGWEAIADRAAELFRPEEILGDMLPAGGRFPLLFADRLYTHPRDREARDRFLRATIERLPGDRDVPPAERFRLEAVASERLGDRSKACGLMELALNAEPSNAEWRQDLGRWLLASGRANDAYRQALIGLHLCPGHAGMDLLRGEAAEAVARGGPVPPPAD